MPELMRDIPEKVAAAIWLEQARDYISEAYETQEAAEAYLDARANALLAGIEPLVEEYLEAVIGGQIVAYFCTPATTR